MKKILSITLAILIFIAVDCFSQSSNIKSYKTNNVFVYNLTPDGKISIRPKYYTDYANSEKRIPKLTQIETSIYPNPALDFATLKITSKIEGNVKIFIEDYSKNRQQIWSGKFYKGENEVQLDLTKYTKGFYLLTIEQGKLLTFQKLIKN
jgi:hypothetical protein